MMAEVGKPSLPHDALPIFAANEGCTAIIGLDAHDNKDLETPMYYDRAVRVLKELKIERIDELRMLI